MARELGGRDLVLAREAGEVTMADLRAAAEWNIRASTEVKPFRLVAR
jgi:hypothetical protein